MADPVDKRPVETKEPWRKAKKKKSKTSSSLARMTAKDDETTDRQDEEGDVKPEICLVCGRASNTGHHYGCLCCLGCKTFFRRVVLQSSPPKCKYDNKCKLEKDINAKRICRSCRFQKCKEIGMKEEALHPCRDLIGRRQPSQSESSPESLSPSSSCELPPVKLCPLAEEALSFLQSLKEMDCAHRRHVIEVEYKTNTMEESDSSEDSMFYPTGLPSSSIELSHDITQSLQTDIRSVQDWVLKVPHFQELSSPFRRHLLRRFCLMYSSLEHGLFTSSMPEQENVWYLVDRTCLVRDFDCIPVEIKNQITPQLRQEHQLLLPYTSLLLDEIASPLRRLLPRPEEISALKVLMLMKPTILREDGTPIATEEDLELLAKVRNKILLGLHSFYSVNGYCVEERLSDLLMLSGGIEICAAQGLEGLHLLRFFDMAHLNEESSQVIYGRGSQIEGST